MKTTGFFLFFSCCESTASKNNNNKLEQLTNNRIEIRLTVPQSQVTVPQLKFCRSFVTTLHIGELKLKFHMYFPAKPGLSATSRIPLYNQGTSRSIKSFKIFKYNVVKYLESKKKILVHIMAPLSTSTQVKISLDILIFTIFFKAEKYNF